MKKIVISGLMLLSFLAVTTNVYAAEDVIYGDDIPVGHESEYEFFETEITIAAYTDLPFDEANSLKVSLESKYTTVTLRSYKVKTGETTRTISEEFESYDAALAYIETLEAEGIVVSDVTFTNNTEQQNGSLNETYASIEDARKSLEEFKNEYEENYSGEIIENKTDIVLEEITGTTSYDTYDLAQEALLEFLNDEANNTDEFYFTGTVVGPKKNGTYTESEINETFASEQQAMEFLNNLEANGYIIVSYSFTNDKEEVNSSLNKTYETLEDANKALNEFKEEYKKLRF